MKDFFMKILRVMRISFFSIAPIILIRWIENWKKSLDEKKFVCGVLMNLSKDFDSYAYGFL